MTFCVHTQTNLIVPTCPLKKGRCYWQHRETKECKYTSESLTIEEYCLLVDTPVPTEEQKELILEKLKAELNP